MPVTEEITTWWVTIKIRFVSSKCLSFCYKRRSCCQDVEEFTPNVDVVGGLPKLLVIYRCFAWDVDMFDEMSIFWKNPDMWWDVDIYLWHFIIDQISTIFLMICGYCWWDLDIFDEQIKTLRRDFLELTREGPGGPKGPIGAQRVPWSQRVPRIWDYVRN